MIICNREGCAFKGASNICTKNILILNQGMCDEWFDKKLAFRAEPLYKIQPKEVINEDQVD